MVDNERQHTPIPSDFRPGGRIGQQRRLIIDRRNRILLSDGVPLDGVRPSNGASLQRATQVALPPTRQSEHPSETVAHLCDVAENLLVASRQLRCCEDHTSTIHVILHASNRRDTFTTNSQDRLLAGDASYFLRNSLAKMDVFLLSSPPEVVPASSCAGVFPSTSGAASWYAKYCPSTSKMSSSAPIAPTTRGSS